MSNTSAEMIITVLDKKNLGSAFLRFFARWKRWRLKIWGLCVLGLLFMILVEMPTFFEPGGLYMLGRLLTSHVAGIAVGCMLGKVLGDEAMHEVLSDARAEEHLLNACRFSGAYRKSKHGKYVIGFITGLIVIMGTGVFLGIVKHSGVFIIGLVIGQVYREEVVFAYMAGHFSKRSASPIG
jgi:hypothetical protein